MYSLDSYFSILDELAPLKFSKMMIERGDYDNSGILIAHHDYVKKALFTLDISVASVKRAKSLRCDTIVTHHPAIYAPLKNLSFKDGTTAPLLMAMNFGMNVISMHLNLDMARGGIDDCLARALGAKECKILDDIGDGNGYGREFCLDVKLGDYAKKVKKTLNTDKIIFYGKNSQIIKKAVSFCGAGGSFAKEFLDKGVIDGDLLVISDLPHHLIKEFLEKGKSVMLIPHYVAEAYGFKEFCLKAEEKSKIETVYFDDSRFR